MKILQISSGDFFSTYGGGQVYVKNIVDEFIRQQVALSVISFVGENKLEKKNYNGIDLFEVRDNINEKDLLNLIQQINPTLIHVHSHKDLICRIGKQFNIPVVVTAHHGGILCPAGSLLDWEDNICSKNICFENCLKCCLCNIRTGKYFYPFMRHLNKNQYIKLGQYLKSKPFIPFVTPIGSAALSIENKIRQWNDIKNLSTCIIAPSNAIAKVMIQNGLDEGKIKIIPHGIPLLDNPPSFPEIKDKIKFFYVGRICYVKGIHIMLKAFSQIRKENIELHLIGGSGNKGEERYMNTLMKKYKSDKRIIWHGKVVPDNVFDTIKDFHIQIHQTICMEIFGLNIAESLYMNKPVLATKCGGAEMQIIDGVNGWLIEPNDVNSLKNKIEEIIININKIKISSISEKVKSISRHITDLFNLYNLSLLSTKNRK